MSRRLYTTQRLAYDEYFLLLLSGRSPSMAMMMMTIICCRGSYEAAALLILPFLIFSLALIAVTLFPSDQPACARATTAQSNV